MERKTLRIIRGEKAIYEKIGLRRTAIEDLVAHGELRWVRIGKRAKGIFEHEADEYLQRRAAKREGGRNEK